MTTTPRVVPPVVPDWLGNLAALAWRVVVIALLGVVLWLLCSLLWTVTAAVAVATVVSALFAPWVVRLTRAGWSRNAAAAIVWTGAIVSIAFVLLLLVLAFLPYLGEMLTRMQAGLTELEAGLAAIDAPPAVMAALRAAFATLREGSGGSAAGLVSAVTGVVTVLVLATFLVFFFLRDGDRAWGWAVQALSDGKRDRITSAATDALVRVGGYLRGTAILSAIIALTDFAFLVLLGVPLAAPLAVLVFFAGFIPYFGGLVTTILLLLVTYAAVGPAAVIGLLLLIAVRNAILGYGIRPALYGRTTSIHPGLVLIALPAGYQIAGVVGLFIAVPVTAVVLAVASAVVAVVEPDPSPPLPLLVPSWLDRIAQWSWRALMALALVGLLVGIFVAIPTVVIPIFLATVLAATLEPLVLALARRGWSRTRAAALAVGGGALVVIVVIILAFMSVMAQAGEIVAASSAGARGASASLGGQGDLLVRLVAGGGAELLAAVRTVAESVASGAVIVLLSTLLAFYVLRDGRWLWGRIVGRAQPGAREELRLAGRRAFDVLGGYMLGTAAISLVGAASQLLIMVVLGIELALPIFVLSFFLCFIPYVGGFISTGIALLVTVATGTTSDVVIMVVWTLVFNIVTGNIVSPLVYGRTVHLHPAIVLVAIPAGAAVAGILGMFFVVPVIGVVAVTWRSIVAIMGARSGPLASGRRSGDAAVPNPTVAPAPASPA